MSTIASPPAEAPPQPSLRDAILARLAVHAADLRAPPVVLVEGPYGVGKSTLLDRLEERLPPDVAHVRVDLDGYSSGSDAEESLTEYRFFLDLLHAVAAGAGTARTDELARAIDAEYEDARSRSDDAVLPDVRRTARRFVDAWNAATAERRAVVLGDGASDALRELVGQWFVSLVATKLSNTLVVLARTSGPIAIEPGAVSVERLTGLSAAEVADVLEEGLGTPPPQRVVDRIVIATGGHPHAVAEYASALRQRAGARADELVGIATDPPTDLQQALARIAQAMRAPVRDEAAQRALELAAVPRRFDDRLLAKLIHEKIDDERKEQARRLMRTLEQYALVEYHEAPGVRGYFAVHPFLRETINRDLRRDLDRYATLHARCESDFWARLNPVQGRREGYEAGSRLEEAQYNADAADFLYHFQHTTAPQAPLMFLTTYFNAFWWWGWFEECESCERLLADEAFRTAPWAGDWHETLRRFHESYPRGADPAGDWAPVQQALNTLLTATDDGAPGTPAERAHLRGILSAFLGQAHQFGADRDLAGARRWYGEALRSFERAGADDAWNLPWMHYYLADLERDLGDARDAPAVARRAIALAEQQNPPHKRDWEVIANCYRVIGDVELARDPAAAFAAYARTALAAYVFQRWPQAADAYTAAYYDEITGRVRGQLEALAERDPGQAAQAVDEIRRVWAAAGVGNGATTADEIFPPAPSRDELESETSPYAVRVREIAPEAARVLAVTGAST